MSDCNRYLFCGGLLALALCLGPHGSYAQTDALPKIVARPVPTETEPTVVDTFKPTPGVPASRAPVGVTRLLAETKNYQSGNLLTWEQVKPVLDRLRRARVPLPPEKELQPMFLRRA